MPANALSKLDGHSRLDVLREVLTRNIYRISCCEVSGRRESQNEKDKFERLELVAATYLLRTFGESDEVMGFPEPSMDLLGDDGDWTEDEA